jgi:hypothetical protein
MVLSKSVFLLGLIVVALASGCAEVQPPGSQAFVEWAYEHVISIENLDSSLAEADVDFIQ